MPRVITSKTVLAEHRPRIDAFLAERRLAVEWLHLPADYAHRLPDAERARIDVGFLTRDVRFSETGLACFIDTLSAAPNLGWIHFSSSGVSQHTWTHPLIAKGVVVSTSVGANADPVSQTCLMGLLMLARPARHWIDGQHRGAWNPVRGNAQPDDLAGQTAIVVGVGEIGGRVVRYLKMLGLRVIGLRRSSKRADDVADAIRPLADLPALLPGADWVILTCPSTDDTRRLMNAKTLALMKPTAHLINMSRGDVVDEAAVIDVLREKRIAGAYLDVYEVEPLPSDSPLWKLPNVILSPHNASASTGNDWRSILAFLENLERREKGEPLRHVWTPGSGE
jgi:phosphoglycerate dehydrogenase-like enzyme